MLTNYADKIESISCYISSTFNEPTINMTKNEFMYSAVSYTAVNELILKMYDYITIDPYDIIIDNMLYYEYLLTKTNKKEKIKIIEIILSCYDLILDFAKNRI